MNNTNTLIYAEGDPWERWFSKTLDLINRYDISMWSYINCDWDSQPMWRNVGFGETRISSNKDVLTKWRKTMFPTGNEAESRFLMAGSLDNCHDNVQSINREELYVGFLSKVQTKITHFHFSSFITLVVCFSCITLIMVHLKKRFQRVRHEPDEFSDEKTVLVNNSKK